MDRFLGLDTLMASVGIKSTKDFEAYYKSVLEPRENMDLNIEGFVWDNPQIDFTYDMLETVDDIPVMAHYVDLNSPAIPSGKHTEFEKLTGSIPRQKFAINRGENDYRKELIIMQEVASVARFQGRNVNTSLKEHLEEYLFITLSDIPEAHKQSLNYQVGQMKSAGALTLTDANNPRGGIRGVTFTAYVPEENFITKAWFTKDAEGNYTVVEGANPVADLKQHIRMLRWNKQYTDVTIEIDEQYAFEIFKMPEVLKSFGYAKSPELRISPKNDDNAIAVGRSLEDDQLKEFFRRQINADRVIYQNTVCAVEKWSAEDKKFKKNKMKAFDADVILVRPSGNIGKIKNVAPLRPDGSAITAGVFGGRGLVEYFYTPKTRVQEWLSELTILAVPSRPKDMFYFKGVAPAESGAATE